MQMADSRGAAITTLATARGTEIAVEGTMCELCAQAFTTNGDR
jgi:UDP-N-acetylmuramyl pentapeptide synthase